MHTRTIGSIMTGAGLGLAALALSRLLYEQFFPQLLWLGRPGLILPLALAIALLFMALAGRRPPAAPPTTAALLAILLAYLLILLPAEVNLTRGWLLWGAAGWLFLIGRPASPVPRALALILALAPIYALTLGRTVGAADTFEFQVVAPQLGIVHPTGYPLYLLLGKLWTLLLPVGQIALRLNVGTAVYALGTAVVLAAVVRELGQGVQGRPNREDILPLALLIPLFFALRPTFWSQAIEAEVYTLHNLIVAAVLLLLVRQLRQPTAERLVWVAALLGLGLTNHLTTLILGPSALLVALFTLPTWRPNGWRWVGRVALALLLPLSLYAYLPLRWPAVNNGEPMGAARFVGWVTGSQFQGALQLWAWWRDPTRYAVVGRLFMAEWTAVGLALAVLGLGWLVWHNWRLAALLGVAWAGFTFYCLNYYVPDLAVFLLPAHLLVALFIGAGLMAVQAAVPRWAATWPLLMVPLLAWQTAALWPTLTRADNTALTTWGQGVLAQPLATNALILADSEKIAPLLYLQRAEGMRPDLTIQVLPDEAAYRAALVAGVAAGRTVYLARYVPGLEGAYHLRSAGPLTEVSAEPLPALPATAEPRAVDFGAVQLVGTAVEPTAAVEPGATAVTLFWQASQPLTQTMHVYVRWAGGAALNPAGQHPAHNNYPMGAWKGAELVADFYLLPHPYPPQATAEVQVALAPPFSRAADLVWQTVATVPLPTIPPILPNGRAVRLWAGPEAWLTAVQWPSPVRPPADPLPVQAQGAGVAEWLFTRQATAQAGTDTVLAAVDGQLLSCGWLRPWATACAVGEVVVQGAAVPEGATNFGDKIALLAADLPPEPLTPGGQWPLTLHWLALSAMTDDYTVFVQVVNEAGVVAQVDSWPLQGTYPTSAWTAGETITDPYVLALPADLPPGPYQLLVGFYRLADLQRLPVLDGAGAAVADKFVVALGGQ